MYPARIPPRNLLLALAPAILLAFASSASAALSLSASSIHPGDYAPEYALDGNPRTRWASLPGPAQHLQIDFARSVAVRSLTIHWERAYAAEYLIELSDDAKAWRTAYHQRDGRGGREAISGIDGQGRYLRIRSLKAGPHALMSIWELEFPDPQPAAAIAEARRAAAEARRAAEAAARKRLTDLLAGQSARDIIFTARHPGGDGHWYANFGYYARDVNRKAYGRPGGRLSRLNLRTGQVTHLIDDPQGSVRDPAVHYDGQRIVFSYRKANTEHFNLYEIDADGKNLRQLTRGDYDDIEPAYLPDGGIIFCSSRCNRWVNCWLTQVAILYRCDADGGNLRPLSSNNEQDNTPIVLPDGRILYTRWEYIDRSQVDYHHLWTMNPDGTDQAVYFGNMRPGIVMIDARPIPGSHRVLATFSPGHGQREHEGPFYIVDPSGGPDAQGLAQPLKIRDGRDPFPLGSDAILFAAGRTIRLADASGADVELHADPAVDLHEPRPLISRPREPVIPSRVNLAQSTGRLVLSDVHIGRNMAGIQRGQIRKLLVLESLPKPINYTGGMDPLTYGGSFTLERIVGTVPVEPDGSAYIELPALRSFFFVALDEQNNSLKRMQSFLTVQPGELTGCVGCHEQRTQTTLPRGNLMALRRAPSRIEPLPGVPEVFDFPRDIQPILDRHCVTCHDYDRRHPQHGPRAGGVILAGDRGPMFSHSYYTLTVKRQIADGRNEPRGNRPPRSIGASASPLMHKILEHHHEVQLQPQEIETVRFWIESAAPYPGTYAALGTGMIGGYDENNPVATDDRWPESRAAAEAITRRCASCHAGPRSLAKTLSDENDLSFWRPDWDDPRLHRSRHLLYNLSRPEKSLALLAPLAKEAGGLGLCETATAKPVFTSTADPDYQKILAMAAAGKRRLDQIKRFDMSGFRPDPAYVREMKRFNVLPPEAPLDTPLDVYDLDQRYWRSLWHTPAPPAPAKQPAAASLTAKPSR